MDATDPLDCLVVGGGPAGLTGAVYLARFRRSVLLVDAGASRAAWIPRSHNLPGYPDGLPGPELLRRQRQQALRYGVPAVAGSVARLIRDQDGFNAEIETPEGRGDTLRARTVLLCTGVLDIEPDLPDVADAVARGLVRHCPVCDGFEVIGQRLGVIGNSSHAIGEALFLRTYSDDVTLLTLGQPLSPGSEDAGRLREAGIRVVDSPVTEVTIEEGRIAALCLREGRPERFDTLYSALGCNIRSGLAQALGARHDGSGALHVDQHQRTSVQGLWAAGDVVCALNQIGVAHGHAAIAATDIHRHLPPRLAGGADTSR